MRTRKAWSMLWPYILVALLIAARKHTEIFRPEFWAEDADEFFVGALSGGLWSMITPVLGYHFLASRIIAYFASFLPLESAPFSYAISALALNALATGYFSRDGFSWLIPSRAGRLFTCVILAIGPGSAEVFMNLVNLASPLTFLTVLMLLEEPSVLGRLKLLALSILILSAGHIFLFGPLVYFLWTISRHKRYLWLLGYLGLVTLVNLAGGVRAAASTGLLSLNYVTLIPRLLIEQSFLNLLVAPLFGPALTQKFMVTPDYVFWPCFAAISWPFMWICFRVWSIDRTRLYLLATTYACAIASFAAVAVARNYAIALIIRQSGAPLWDMRYSYLPGQIAIIIWFALLFSLRDNPQVHKPVTYGIIAVISLWNLSRWYYIYERPDLGWPHAAKVLSQAIDLTRQGLLLHPCTIHGIRIHPYWYHHAQMSITINPDGHLTTQPDVSAGPEQLQQ